VDAAVSIKFGCPIIGVAEVTVEHAVVAGPIMDTEAAAISVKGLSAETAGRVRGFGIVGVTVLGEERL
jgi:hypothetical protein